MIAQALKSANCLFWFLLCFPGNADTQEEQSTLQAVSGVVGELFGLSSPTSVVDASILKTHPEFQRLISELKDHPNYFSWNSSEIARYPAAIASIICAASQLDADNFFVFCEDVLAAEEAVKYPIRGAENGVAFDAGVEPNDFLASNLLFPSWREDRGVLYKYQMLPRARRIIIEARGRISDSISGQELRDAVDQTYYTIHLRKLFPFSLLLASLFPAVWFWWYKRRQGPVRRDAVGH